ncbi:MAG: CrcB family protein [Cryomorphaceae bacterium]
MSWTSAIAVFIGGGFGSLLRFAISAAFRNFDVQTMVWSTLTSNILASAFLGWVVFKLAPLTASPLYLLLAIGFCGGFSTFSTFSLETMHLIKEEHMGLALFNVLASVSICVVLLFFLSKLLK